MATIADPQPRHHHARQRPATAGTRSPDGAVLQEDGIIAAIGTYDDLHRKYPDRAGDRHRQARSCCRASSTATTMSA